MRLTHLSLTNFRNYARLELDLGPGATLLVGDNAQGKSNLLEAVGYLATARSFRAGAERELIHWLAFREPQPYARVVGRWRQGSGPLKAEIVLAAAPGCPAPPAVRRSGGETRRRAVRRRWRPQWHRRWWATPQPGLTKRLRAERRAPSAPWTSWAR